MKLPKLTPLLQSARTMASKHTPEILFAFGLTGMITTTIVAVRATPKALQLIEDAKAAGGYSDDEPMPKIAIVKSCWKCYAPAFLIGAVSVACLIGSNSVSVRRNAALTAAYKLSEKALVEYREKTLETVGEKKEQAIREKVAESQLERNPVSKNEIIIAKKGDTLCYDTLSSRYFKSDIDLLKRAQNDLNERIFNGMYGGVSLNEFYDEIGLPHMGVGDDLGWNTSNKIDLDLDACLADDGTPCIVVGHHNAPTYGY